VDANKNGVDDRLEKLTRSGGKEIVSE
jgi:hypothetical protein